VSAPHNASIWGVRCPKCLRTRPLRDDRALPPKAEGRKTAARCGRCGIVFAEVVRLARGTDASLAESAAGPLPPGARRAAG
jgi:hypothetical protein